MDLATMKDAEYVVDLTQTFFANLWWTLFLLIVGGLAILLFDKIDTLEDDTNRLLAVIISAFAVIQMLRWGGSPHLHFKPRPKKEVIK